MNAPLTAPHGPWNPGIESQIPGPLLPLATLYRPEHASAPLHDLLELADLTGLPLREIVPFRPERLALHELLVRVTANVSVDDGTRIEDLGINFRRIVQAILDREVLPRMTELVSRYEAARAALGAVIERELARLDAPAPPAPRKSLVARLLGERAAPPPPPAVADAAQVADWEARARTATAMERAALRALARVVGAVLVKHERMWGDRSLIGRMALDLAANDWGSAVVGEAIEPLVAQAARREGFRILSRQEHPVVMNTKGPSAAGKSTMRPLQKQLASRIGVDWAEFALISPDIWRKQLLDYGSLGPHYKYAGAFTGDELAIVDQKLDRYIAGKAQRDVLSHLLIDRFRFDSFAPDSDEAGSNLLTRFGQIVYMFFLVTPPAALVERAWNRGLDVGRYKAVDDTLAHSVEAYAGMPELFFTWVRRADKRVHFEVLDNSVARGAPPRTAAFGWNDTLNVLDVECLQNVERFRKIAVEARSPDELYSDSTALAPERNVAFLGRCLTEFREVNFADQATGRIYLTLTRGKVTAYDAVALAGRPLAALRAVLPDLDAAPAMSVPRWLDDAERTHTVGTWKTISG